MARTFAFTLDLESDYASLLPQVRHRILETPERVREVLKTLDNHGIRGTAFVVGQVLESHPAIIDLFEEFKWEFELHSYSHDVAAPDSKEELAKGCAAFYRRFGRQPSGYRAPQGRITRDGMARLAALGFRYDASIFPSYWPNPFRYLAMPRDIHFKTLDEKTRLLEIPFTSVSPLRLTLSTSYMKLLGPLFYRGVLRAFGFPSTICFDSHLHDFVVDDQSYRELPPFWRFVYGRNKENGLSITTALIDLMRAHGYAFQYLSTIADQVLEGAPAIAEARAVR